MNRRFLPSIEQGEDRPFALTAAIRNVQQLAAVNEVARAVGLTLGMTLTHARALLPDLSTAPADPAGDRIDLEKLADWCGGYSPSFGLDRYDGLWGDCWFLGDDGLWIDVTGCAHLFGGEEALLADLEHRLNGFGIRHGLGLAETLGGAWALARYNAAARIVPPGHLPQALADLPVAGLRLLPETVMLLKRLGLKLIGQLEALPRVALGKRFSSKERGEAVLQRLDQAYGREEEPRCPERPLPVHRIQQGFLEPIIELPALAHMVTQLTSDLCRRLDRAGEGAVRLTLLAFRVDGDVRHLRVGTSQPTRDRHHIERLFAERLETIDAGFGIETLVLHADRVAPLGPKQITLGGRITDETDQDERLAQLIDRLANRLGSDAVMVITPVESHIPERAEGRRQAASGSTSKEWKDTPLPSCPRPSCLLLRPESVKALAEVPDGPPLRFTWRRVTRRIVKSEGPERIAPPWVGAADSVDLALETRDYYRVEDDEGRRYWLFRKGLYDTGGYADTTPDHQTGAVGRADQVSAVDRIGWFIHGVFG